MRTHEHRTRWAEKVVEVILVNRVFIDDVPADSEWSPGFLG